MASLPSRERELKLSRYTEEKIKSESLPSRERELKPLSFSVHLLLCRRSPRGSVN